MSATLKTRLLAEGLLAAAAATVIALLPPVVLSIVFQRYIVSGLAQGSTK